MMDLLFLDQETIEANYEEVERIITGQSSKLVIYNINQEQMKSATSNLETLCCAILKLPVDHTQYAKKKDIKPLSDAVLSSHLNVVSKSRGRGSIAHVVDQLVFIENMAKQPKFYLSESQLGRIHTQFKNFYQTRKELSERENKKKIREKILQDENQRCPYQPKLNSEKRTNLALDRMKSPNQVKQLKRQIGSRSRSNLRPQDPTDEDPQNQSKNV